MILNFIVSFASAYINLHLLSSSIFQIPLPYIKDADTVSDWSVMSRTGLLLTKTKYQDCTSSKDHNQSTDMRVIYSN